MLTGYYYDPKHGGCLRKISKIDENSFKIIGAYGNDEPNTNKKWTAIMKKTKKRDEYLVDFSGKKHVNHGSYISKWVNKDRVLKWEDGNTWVLMYDWYLK
uniref:Uncharacterized protein n=1 Tax=viral metagenome TaxID=1070528 RepID=A0A6C0L0S9_9ZZZZ|tara:strand:- start:23683 stop:23982 length:300 start_codon:yes stop_codon:yes gene_type:complete